MCLTLVDRECCYYRQCHISRNFPKHRSVWNFLTTPSGVSNLRHLRAHFSLRQTSEQTRPVMELQQQPLDLSVKNKHLDFDLEDEWDNQPLNLKISHIPSPSSNKQAISCLSAYQIKHQHISNIWGRNSPLKSNNIIAYIISYIGEFIRLTYIVAVITAFISN